MIITHFIYKRVRAIKASRIYTHVHHLLALGASPALSYEWGGGNLKLNIYLLI